MKNSEKSHRRAPGETLHQLQVHPQLLSVYHLAICVKIIISNTKFIILDQKSIILYTKFINFDTNRYLQPKLRVR